MASLLILDESPRQTAVKLHSRWTEGGKKIGGENQRWQLVVESLWGVDVSHTHT